MKICRQPLPLKPHFNFLLPISTPQLATLAAITLEKETSPALGALITNLNDTSMDGLNEYERANVRDAKRNYERSTKTNKDLEMRIARLQTKGYMTWDEAKKKNDFALFKPILEEWVDIWEEKAALLDPTKSVYDVGVVRWHYSLFLCILHDSTSNIGLNRSPPPPPPYILHPLHRTC